MTSFFDVDSLSFKIDSINEFQISRFKPVFAVKWHDFKFSGPLKR